LVTLQSKLQGGEGTKLQRVIGYLLSLIQHSVPHEEEYYSSRKGCPQLIPELHATPFWDTTAFSWVAELESHVGELQREFLTIREAQNIQAPALDIETNGGDSSNNNRSDPTSSVGFQHYRAPASEVEVVQSGHWNVCYLMLHGMDFSLNASHCPITMKLIQNISGQYQHAFFSALSPNAHIGAHFGPTNKKLRCYLPLFVPPADNSDSRCWLKVKGEIRFLEEGKCLIFDDSFLHEAGNGNSENPRVNLIFDIWHPDLTAEEVS
jgi:aspartate beta-hydroxylase